MRSTIRDVARQAGVSIATVSRVMRDATNVRPDTAERVRQVAADLEFVPSYLGRQLAERRHAANGIVFPDLSGPYYAEVVLGYEAVAAELGRSVLILSTHGRDDADSAVLAMAERCDGMVLLTRTVGDETVERLVKRGVNLVLVARPKVAAADSINAENHDSAIELVDHLAERGAKDLQFVGDPDLTSDVAERWAGVSTRSAAGGLTARPPVLAGFDEDAGARVAVQALKEGDLPDAFVCANDELALGLMARLQEEGIDVPGDVMVTGWDDVMAARYAGLTTVRQPMRELGGTAARLLDELIAGSRDTPRHELLKTELVTRTSTLGKEPA